MDEMYFKRCHSTILAHLSVKMNVSAYSKLKNMYTSGDTYIEHPAYGGTMKTYLFFDIVHLIKNVRNYLLGIKKFSFPEFSFNKFEDEIKVKAGYVIIIDR